MRLFCLPALLFLVALPALAQEQKIREALEPRLGVKVEGVQPSPLPGIYEVRLQTLDGPKIVYSDEKGSYVFTGRLIDVKAERDLTEERLQKLSTIEFSQLPLDLAVKVQRGNGKRVLAMFSDPYCPYCRRLEQTLLQIDDLTVYVFMYPVIRPDLADHSRAVWCSKDRAKAWIELAANEKPKVPTASASCANPVDKVLELGRSLRVNGTPTLYFANGEKASGGMEIGALRKKLDELARLK
ncbi:MAG TPA: DsbC family protein [Burkholderiales bacterium]|jgi:thiol:disulfide interchange protein DsbC|nr:DsbC family protein [Burkholderiales bacterium]